MLYLSQFLNWAPALSNETALCDIKIEHVHGVVDGLDLLNLWREGEREKEWYEYYKKRTQCVHTLGYSYNYTSYSKCSPGEYAL